MAWCEQCDRYLTPNTLSADGTCPYCGTEAGAESEPQPSSSPASRRVPWHFWLLLAATVGYLSWRLVQGVSSLADLLW